MIVASVWGQSETAPVDIVAYPGEVLAEAVSNDDKKTTDDRNRHGLEHDCGHGLGHDCRHGLGHDCGHGLEHDCRHGLEHHHHGR